MVKEFLLVELCLFEADDIAGVFDVRLAILGNFEWVEVLYLIAADSCLNVVPVVATISNDKAKAEHISFSLCHAKKPICLPLFDIIESRANIKREQSISDLKIVCYRTIA